MVRLRWTQMDVVKLKTFNWIFFLKFRLKSYIDAQHEIDSWISCFSKTS